MRKPKGMRNLTDKNYKRLEQKLNKEVSSLEKVLNEIYELKWKLSQKHFPHRGSLTLAGSLNKKYGFNKVERRCIVCGESFISKSYVEESK